MAKTKISKYFYDYEVRKSNTANANNIDNTPSAEIMEDAKQFANEVLDKIREYYGHSLTPNSWYRCEELEKILAASGYRRWLRRKGLIASDLNWAKYFAIKQHPKGIAADIPAKNGESLKVTYSWMKENLDYDQLIIETAGSKSWIHVSWNPNGGNRKEAFSLNT